MDTIFIVIAVLVGLGIVLLVIYNSLIGKRNQVDQAFASVDVMLKKRYDLIPNLVASVDRYMVHERDLLSKLTELRTRAIQADISTPERVDLDNQISTALGRVLVSVEAYPDLKASQNFLQLQRAINETEEQISAARRAYNAAVTDYNTAIQMVPANILAGMLGFTARPLFTASEAERHNVDVRTMFQGDR